MPLHFSAFHPDYRMVDVPPTPPSTLRRAREIALGAGLRHVYTGNVHDVEGDTTRCAACGATLVVRDWYRILDYRLDERGRCPGCGTALAGRYAERCGDFGSARSGPRRMPVVLGG